MKYPRALMGAVGLCVAASPAFSQSNPCAPGFGGGGGQSTPTGWVFTYNFPQIVSRGLAGQPYSGQTTNETVRTLANGGQLTLPTQVSPMMYRDSMGRTRTDSRMIQQPGPNATGKLARPYEINDPVAGYRYIVDDFHQIAYRIAACTPIPRTVRPATATEAPTRPLTTVTTEDLGTQTMQGVTVTGQREIVTFPPGTYQGNNQTVTRVQETWRSAQVGLNFLSKTTTPEGQITTQTMTNFTAGEPNPALFQPPPGYQIVDETAQFTITIPFK